MSADRWIGMSRRPRSCSRPRVASSSTSSISIFTIASTSGCGRKTAAASDDTTPTWDVLHTYPHDYKVIFVGDASMSPYEVMAPGGSIEHFNEETGAIWLER